MGGEAFRSVAAPNAPTLNVTRLTQAEYINLKAIYTVRLEQFFGEAAEVTALLEAPEKQSHGDIDFVVAFDGPAVDLCEMATSIGACGFVSEEGTHCNVAVLKDGSSSRHGEVVVYKKSATPATNFTPEEYVQIDVAIVPHSELEWKTFFWSYGGIGSLIGMMISPLGFTLSSSRGLFLLLKESQRVEELKLGVPGKDAMVPLTKSSAEVMKFLNLDVAAYGRGFETVAQMYAWLGTCCVLKQEVLRMHKHGGLRERQNEKRTIYNTFKTFWIPKNIPPHLPPSASNEDLAVFIATLRASEETRALHFFPGAQATHNRLHSLYLHDVLTATAVTLLRPLVAEVISFNETSKQVKDVMRGMKRFTGVWEGGVPFTKLDLSVEEIGGLVADDGRGFMNERAVKQYVEDNWDDLRRRGKG